MKERLIWADSLKGILITLVVVGHSIQYVIGNLCFDNKIWNLIYSFHMAAFISVSGFFSYRIEFNSCWNKIIKRVKQLLIPFFSWSFLSYFINYPYTIKELFDIVLYPDGAFWFLWVLWVISIIFYIVENISIKLKINVDCVLIFIGLILVSIMCLFNIRILGFQFIAYYYLFYIMGFFINKYKNKILINKHVLFFLLLSWFIGASFWKMHELPFFLRKIKFIPTSILLYGYRYIIASIAVIILLVGAPVILNVKSEINLLIVKLGRNSLGIYPIHIILMSLICRIIPISFYEYKILLVILLSLISLVLSYWFVLCLEKVKILSFIYLGKK